MNFITKHFPWLTRKGREGILNAAVYSAVAAERRTLTQEASEIMRRANVSLLTQAIAACPQDHLIILGRTTGFGGKWEDSVETFLSEMNKDDSFRKERGTCRICVNPQVMQMHSDTPEDIISFTIPKSCARDVIRRWEYVPYPDWWTTT